MNFAENQNINSSDLNKSPKPSPDDSRAQCISPDSNEVHIDSDISFYNEHNSYND